MAKKSKDPVTPGGDMARKIWLAGIGAYGRAFSEAQESLVKMSGETTKRFEDLVERGEEIEQDVENRGRALAKRIKTQPFSMEERIKEMRERLKLGAATSDATDDRLSAIEARLEAIEEKLDQLLSVKRPRKKTKTTRAKST